MFAFKVFLFTWADVLANEFERKKIVEKVKLVLWVVELNK